jgi:hypothetical protein
LKMGWVGFGWGLGKEGKRWMGHVHSVYRERNT